jgi:hypothetical protein
MMFRIPLVELEHQPTTHNEALILGSAVCALTAEQPLIPATACLNIVYADEWLRSHKNARKLAQFGRNRQQALSPQAGFGSAWMPEPRRDERRGT